MLKPILSLTAALTLLAAASGPIHAQSGDKTKPVTSHTDRTTADPATRKKLNEKLRAERTKRNACIKEFKASKTSLLKRNQFIKDCMAKS